MSKRLGGNTLLKLRLSRASFHRAQVYFAQAFHAEYEGNVLRPLHDGEVLGSAFTGNFGVS